MLEIGPGSEPFPVAVDATVTYADKRVGGRDDTWPELAGTPRGPEAHVDIDLDRDGLTPFEDDRFDVVVASHVIEHVADPVGALIELVRVVRPGGHVLLAVPDRAATFDRVRRPTTASHVITEHEAGVCEVSDQHIVEFCEAIWMQPPFHPEPVRSWHDPAALDTERFELHRRRSIHVHVWNAEEFVSLLVTLTDLGAVALRLRRAWVREDEDARDDEFGLVLEKIDREPSATDDLVASWCDVILGRPGRDPSRLIDLGAALDRDLPVPTNSTTQIVRDALRTTVRDAQRALDETALLRAELDRVVSSPSHRLGRTLTAPARLLRDRRS